MSERRRTYSSSSRFPGLLISNLVFTDIKLGRGADATVYEVEWNGTLCAAKCLHEILLEDESPGGVEKLIGNFEAECITWSRLHHPGVVQFLGVHLERKSRLPMLILEKMDTSLRRYLEDHAKEDFPLHLKTYVLRQVIQALVYLHSKSPPLVHHDLSPNNVLLNVVSFVAKVSDFGMSRAINPSSLTRKSSMKGTQAFMAPEALQKVPKYDTKLDVFSFGNIIISSVTHEWPDPDPPTLYKGERLIASNELQRRKRYIAAFTAQEKQLFSATVGQCLDNRPEKRPSSALLLQEMKRVELTLTRGRHVATPLQLHQQLSAMQEEGKLKDQRLRESAEDLRMKDMAIKRAYEANRQKDKALQGKEEALEEKEEALKEKEDALKAKEKVIREQAAVIKGQDEALRHIHDLVGEKSKALKEKEKALQEMEAKIEQLRHEKSGSDPIPALEDCTAAAQKGRPLLRDWRQLGECKKVIQHSPAGGKYGAVAVNSKGLLAVADDENKCVHLFTNDGILVRSIGEGLLGAFVPGIAFDLTGNVLMTDCGNNKVVKLSQDGQIVQVISNTSGGKNHFNCLRGISVSPDCLIYICDHGNHRVTVHNDDGKFQFAFGSKGSGPGCFNGPHDIAFGPDGLVYITDLWNKRVCVWLKDGRFLRSFKTTYNTLCIAATSDNHLLITARLSDIVMVYTVKGKLLHEFGGFGGIPGTFCAAQGICVDSRGMVYVADSENNRVQVF